MSTLKNTIESLAAHFASSIVNALKGASMDELAGYTGTKVSAPAPAASRAAHVTPVAAPAKRGPGRPKKVAAAAPVAAPAAAPKKRGRPAGSGKKAASQKPAPKPAPKSAPKAAAHAASDGGRLQRRSMEDIGQVVHDIVALLGQHAEGLRSEQIRSALNLQAKELPRPLADGLAAGTITKVGQKRATTYFAGKGKKKK